MTIYFNFKFIFELYWKINKNYTNIISTWNTHMKQHKHLHSHVHKKNTLKYVPHTKIFMTYIWWPITLCILFNTHSNHFNLENCHMYQTPKYLWHTCDDLQLYALFSTHIQAIIILKIVICNTHQNIYDIHVITYNFIYSFQHIFKNTYKQ
jgi:hypothetical protein